jgi:hypothetical protein
LAPLLCLNLRQERSQAKKYLTIIIPALNLAIFFKRVKLSIMAASTIKVHITNLKTPSKTRLPESSLKKMTPLKTISSLFACLTSSNWSQKAHPKMVLKRSRKMTPIRKLNLPIVCSWLSTTASSAQASLEVTFLVQHL